MRVDDINKLTDEQIKLAYAAIVLIHCPITTLKLVTKPMPENLDMEPLLYTRSQVAVLTV
jgi:hypothetical protein